MEMRKGLKGKDTPFGYAEVDAGGDGGKIVSVKLGDFRLWFTKAEARAFMVGLEEVITLAEGAEADAREKGLRDCFGAKRRVYFGHSPCVTLPTAKRPTDEGV